MNNRNPLTSTQIRLLQAGLNHRTVNSRKLARLLYISNNTVRTEFQQICINLGAHERTEALIIALQMGWIELPPPPQNEEDKESIGQSE